MGMCFGSVQHKRAVAADSCGRMNETACTTTILHFHFGETGDPAIWFPLDQLRTWLELQGGEMGHRLEKIDIARAWAAASANMRKRSRWNMVRGPMTATMANLHDLNIIPASPWKWYPLKTRTSTGPTLALTPGRVPQCDATETLPQSLETGGTALPLSLCGKME